MPLSWKNLFHRVRPKSYGRRPSIVLINGLAEQQESWYRNFRFWQRFFDIHTPNLLAYEGPFLQQRIQNRQPITIEYLVDQLYIYLTQFAQTPPYHLVSSSLGGKIAVEFAIKYPELVSRVVLICPSGMGDEERLPIMEGVKHNDYQAVIRSVFHKPRKADMEMLRYYKRAFNSRKWKMGLIKTVKGTNDHVVRPRLPQLTQPTLFISGEKDKIVDPLVGQTAAADLPNGQHLMIPKCGHAPQIEKPWLINRLVVHFLTSPRPTSNPGFMKLLLHKPRRAST